MDQAVINKRGFRLSVGMVLVNQQGKVFWGRRVGDLNAWQFPQGGFLPNETPYEAMIRELKEEIGLTVSEVIYVAETRRWYRYRLSARFRRYENGRALCIGQRQKWFLLRLVSDDACISLTHLSQPEFDQWCWVEYWYPINHVVKFKRGIYRKVLKEFFEFVQP
ncbi:RNA pyrophosphohydrolase [Coxiella-like endosymbiont]|uniref:RNA pyrophosphohydrolase n=1 Tax=Coxiella-like endosymbiont TaxID=1592897 RepID=UPI00272BF751|nr:RNA pyrophosphohydrolase [Coxiella-like endosymbiont]